MFSNITEVYQVNHAFWDNCLLPALNAAREQHSLLNPMLLRDGFLRFEETFQPYMKYCLDQNNCVHYVKDKRIESDLYKTYIAVSCSSSSVHSELPWPLIFWPCCSHCYNKASTHQALGASEYSPQIVKFAWTKHCMTRDIVARNSQQVRSTGMSPVGVDVY